MPVENDGQSVAREPRGQPSIQTPSQITRDQQIPTATADKAPRQYEPIAREIEKELKTGEQWLIGVGIATLLINTVIASIYWGQLKEMREATKAATQASKTASDTLAQMQADSNASANQFKTQLGKLNESVSQTRRLAEATEEANRNLVEADRPWIGAMISVSPIELGRIPKATFTFANNGKRPGYILEIHYYAGLFSTFPSNPVYPPSDHKGGEGLVSPGGASAVTYDLVGEPIMQSTVDAINSRKKTIFAFGYVSYKDVRTNRVYFTHTCIVFRFPTSPEPPSFVTCPTYNDGN